MTLFMLLSLGHTAIARVHRIPLINAEQCQLAANLWTKPLSACGQYSVHHCHLLLLTSKAGTHFNMPRRVES